MLEVAEQLAARRPMSLSASLHCLAHSLLVNSKKVPACLPVRELLVQHRT